MLVRREAMVECVMTEAFSRMSMLFRRESEDLVPLPSAVARDFLTCSGRNRRKRYCREGRQAGRLHRSMAACARRLAQLWSRQRGRPASVQERRVPPSSICIRAWSLLVTQTADVASSRLVFVSIGLESDRLVDRRRRRRRRARAHGIDELATKRVVV